MRTFAAALAVTGAQAFYYDKMSNLMALQQLDNGFSAINIELDGAMKTYYVASDSARSTSGSDYTVDANGRGYLLETPTLDYSNPQYFRPNLLGGTVEYDVDLSDHECGCIAAFYLVSMPGKD